MKIRLSYDDIYELDIKLMNMILDEYATNDKAYNLPKTSEWLKQFDYNFEEIVRWLKIEEIFVDDKYEVYDLECRDTRFMEGR